MFANQPTRRHFMQASAAATLAALTGSEARLLAAPTKIEPRADSVILLWMAGGPSHIDTWDPKPDIVSNNRSPYKPIATRVPGFTFLM